MVGALGADGYVLLSDYAHTKISFEHPELTFADYCRIPEILRLGYACKSARTTPSVDVYYLDTYLPKPRGWHLAIKTTSKREIYVATFHLVNLKELRRTYNRAIRTKTLIQEPKRELARRISRRAS